MKLTLKLSLLKEEYSIYRFPPENDLTRLVGGKAEFLSVTRTAEEVSLVAPKGTVSGAQKEESPFRVIKVHGPLDFGLVGIIARMTTPLAAAHISVFVLSTFDTDYVLIKSDKVHAALDVLKKSGFVVIS